MGVDYDWPKLPLEPDVLRSLPNDELPVVPVPVVPVPELL